MSLIVSRLFSSDGSRWEFIPDHPDYRIISVIQRSVNNLWWINVNPSDKGGKIKG